nr:A24 family peptidase [Agromyces seonyuensis]
MPVALVFAVAGVAASAVDLVEHRLPNAILLPAFLVIAVCVAAAGFTVGPEVLWQALAGGTAMLVVYGVVALLSPRSMGMGDVKLAGIIGITLGVFGLTTWVIGLLGAFLVGGLVALVTLARGRAGLGSAIPFGPSMVAGAIAGLLLG